MQPDATRPSQASTSPTIVPTLYVAFDLGGTSWKLATTTGPGQAPRLQTVPARALDRTLRELTRAKTRFHLAADAPHRQLL